ncbi:MAG: ParB/RepB/Spo0J family partition protein [Clostridia bacterium]|nr:ParB/RepB/Spo0J family partition protein [Clostridia bacterium]
MINKGQAKGLDALFKTQGVRKQDSDSVKSLRISELEPRKDQPRRIFDETALNQLADSIKSNGVLQPILVTKQPNGFYSIVAGERRYRASKIAGLTEVPALIIDADEKKIAEIALIENLQREDLNPIEEAAAYRSLMKEHEMTQEELSQRVGKSRSAIANSTRLLELPDEVTEMVIEGVLSAGHARTLLGLTKSDDILKAAQAVVTRELSVRATEALVKTLNSAAAKAENEQIPEKIKVNYCAELEKRVEDAIGRKVKITSRGSAKRIEISFSSNEDLEELLKLLCGQEFFEDI